MPYAHPMLGETTEIGCQFQEREGTAFTITEASVTIVDSDDTKVRDGVAAEIDGASAFYVETFSGANGYSAGEEYVAVFRATISCEGTTYVEKHEDTFVVKPASDE